MRKPIEIIAFFSLLAILWQIGCNVNSTTFKPSICVEIAETSNRQAIVVRFRNHGRSSPDPQVVLDSPEAIDDYLKEIDFLSLRLKEVREKMISTDTTN